MNTTSNAPRRRTRMAVAAAAVTAATVLVPIAGAAGASAADAPGSAHFDTAKQRCTDAATRRLETLDKDQARLARATAAPAADRDELSSQLTATTTDLTHRAEAIGQATTPEALREACGGLVSSSRVYALDGPKVASVMATSWLAKADAAVVKNEGRLPAVVANAEKRGVSAASIADAEAKLADAREALADAHHQIDGLSAELLPVTPAELNDGTQRATVEQSRSRLRAALDDAKRIRADLRAAVADLRTP